MAESRQMFRVSGHVIDRSTGNGVSGLRVESWNKDTQDHAMLGVDYTDAAGRFRITFDETYGGDFAPDRLPDLFFRVLKGETLIKSTEGAVLRNGAAGEREVTIEVDMPRVEQRGEDRVSAAQVLKGIEFMRQSDFRGVWTDTTDKLTTFGSFLTDIVKAGVASADLAPVRPSSVQTRQVINQDVGTAQQHLAAQQVTVQEVKPYEPGLNAQSIRDLTAFPVRLKPGDKVNLFTENGRVRYYSVVPAGQEPTPPSPNATEMARAVDEMRQELAAIRQQTTQKDQQIASLQQELSALRVAHEEMVSRVTPERVARMEQEIQALQEQRANVAPPARSRRRS